MTDVEETKEKLRLARAAEVEAERNAVGALADAMRARRLALHAWMAHATAQGSKDTFPKTYQDCATLLWRSENRASLYVSRALSTSFWSSLSEILPV
jgi:hypothetical protein